MNIVEDIGDRVLEDIKRDTEPTIEHHGPHMTVMNIKSVVPCNSILIVTDTKTITKTTALDKPVCFGEFNAESTKCLIGYCVVPYKTAANDRVNNSRPRFSPK